MRLLRASERIATPWKNGGGTTTAVAVSPPGAGFDDFGWRVSIAEIRQGGPFSIFPSIDRKLAVLDGHMSLAIAGRESIDLSSASVPAEFPGDVACEATLIGGPITDLNVMTRRSAFASKLTRCAFEGAFTARRRSAAAVAIALTEMTATHADGIYKLNARDGLLMEEEPAERIAFCAAAGVAILFWIGIDTA
ncbi:MAG: HutD family protein [Rhizomicrobium sp.]